MYNCEYFKLYKLKSIKQSELERCKEWLQHKNDTNDENDENYTDSEGMPTLTSGSECEGYVGRRGRRQRDSDLDYTSSSSYSENININPNYLRDEDIKQASSVSRSNNAASKTAQRDF